MTTIRELSQPFVQQIRTAAERLAVTVARDGDRAAVEEAKRRVTVFDLAQAEACRPVGDGGAVVLRGLAAADMSRTSPTPASWSKATPQATAQWNAMLLLIASAIGNAFGWEGQQDGRLVHDIVPSKGHEQEQTGASSTVTLSAHTEDAFHPGRANLLLLACVRNDDAVPTLLSSVRHTELSAADRALLERPTLPILPDDSYSSTNGNAATAPPEVATLWNCDEGLGIRYDPAYTPLEQADPDYRAAYDRLTAELDRVAVDVTLEAGEVLVIDNDVAVHGRQPFRARYDGTDRWLKRVSVRQPSAERPAAEEAEHGYGQRLIDPFASS
jgi:L-asparagine oxygenase